MKISLKSFAEKWCSPDYPPEVVLGSELDSVEAYFGIFLPVEYREQVLAVGLPKPTGALLSAISDGELDLHDLSQLCNPTEVKEETIGWREAGLPDNLLVIGNDCMGNKFCFDLFNLEKQTSGSVPVYFWDHEFFETDQIAPSFSDWIDAYQGKWSDGISHTDI